MLLYDSRVFFYLPKFKMVRFERLICLRSIISFSISINLSGNIDTKCKGLPFRNIFDTEREFVGIKRSPFGFEALTKNLERTKELFGDSLIYEKPTLEDIMFYTKKGTDGYVETHL